MPPKHFAPQAPWPRASFQTHRARHGFTLVELIIVIIILGILAALAIPQFADSTQDARESTLQANQALIEKAIQRYRLDHGDKFPDTRIVEQLTQYTKGNGDPSTTKGPPFNFGPYLNAFPPNALAPAGVEPRSVSVVDSAAPLSPDANPTSGWKYSTATGQIIANNPA